MKEFDVEKELMDLKLWTDHLIQSVEDDIKQSNEEGDKEFLTSFKVAVEEYKELIKQQKFTSSELKIRLHGEILLEMEKRGLEPLE